MAKAKNSIYNEEYMDTFNIEPKNKKVYTNTVRTSVGRCDDYGIIDGDTVKPTPEMKDLKSNFSDPFKPDGHWASDNKTDDVNLDSIDNKTSYPGKRGKEKITPIEIKITPLDNEKLGIGEESNKFKDYYIDKDFYHKVLDCLKNYKTLILADISRLTGYFYSKPEDILKLAKDLCNVEEVIKLTRETFKPDQAPVVLDRLDEKHIPSIDYRNAVDSNFLTEQIEKAMQTPEIFKKIVNGVMASNVCKKDIAANKTKEN